MLKNSSFFSEYKDSFGKIYSSPKFSLFHEFLTHFFLFNVLKTYQCNEEFRVYHQKQGLFRRDLFALDSLLDGVFLAQLVMATCSFQESVKNKIDNCLNFCQGYFKKVCSKLLGKSLRSDTALLAQFEFWMNKTTQTLLEQPHSNSRFVPRSTMSRLTRYESARSSLKIPVFRLIFDSFILKVHK